MAVTAEAVREKSVAASRENYCPRRAAAVGILLELHSLNLTRALGGTAAKIEGGGFDSSWK